MSVDVKEREEEEADAEAERFPAVAGGRRR